MPATAFPLTLLPPLERATSTPITVVYYVLVTNGRRATITSDLYVVRAMAFPDYCPAHAASLSGVPASCASSGSMYEAPSPPIARAQ